MNQGPANPTGTLEGARAHARSLVAAAGRSAITVPAADATDLPAGVDPTSVLHDETVDVHGYAALRLPRHAHLRITDVDGDACVGLVVFNAHNVAERLNVADTVKVQWQAYLDVGAILLSDMGRALATIVDDSSRRHDALCGTSTLRSNTQRYGHGAIHGPTPGARELFVVAAAKQGCSRRDLPPALSFFKGVHVALDGSLGYAGAPQPGAAVELRADLDLLVLVVNSPHPLDPRPVATGSPARLTAWRADPPPDPITHASTPERARAYRNTAQHLLGWAS